MIGSFDSDGYSEVFIYTYDLLTTIKEYEDGVLDGETVLEYDSSNRLIRETYTYDIDSGSNNVNEFTYNVDGTITEFEDNINTYIYTYDANGNRIIEEDVDGDNDYTFTYDTKKNPFKNIHQRDVFELLGHFTYRNNILTSVYSGGESFSDAFSSTYSYNTDDYPESETTTYEPGTANEEMETVQYIYEIRVF